MKKIFTLFLALVATTALWAEYFEVDGIYYNILTDKTNEVEVTFISSDYMVSVTIPETVTYYGIIYSVTSIGESAFGHCSSLTSITIPNSVTSIGDEAFAGCSGLTSIEIPNSVTSIGERAFSGCSGLTSITIPNSVTSIGSWAFEGCSGLTSITIPNSVTTIEYGAFYGCSGLTSITIPNSVTSIGGYAFSGCSGLAIITCGNVNPPTLERDVFFRLNQSKIILYVPIEAVDTYKSIPVWQDFDIEGKNTINSVENNYIPSANTQKLLRNGQLVIVRDGKTYNAMGVEM